MFYRHRTLNFGSLVLAATLGVIGAPLSAAAQATTAAPVTTTQTSTSAPATTTAAPSTTGTTTATGATTTIPTVILPVPPCDWADPTTKIAYSPSCSTYDYTDEAQGDPTDPQAVLPTATDKFTKSTRVYPGNTPSDGSPLKLPDGSCWYVNNNSKNTYFIPLNTLTEWNDFKYAVDPTSATATEVSKILSLVSCPVIPAVSSCGTANANTAASSTAPTTGLCAVGTPSSVTKNTTTCQWTWTCTNTASSNQTSASCMTPALTTTSTSTSAVTKPVQIVIILDASASMEAFDQAAAAAAGQVLQQFLNQTSLNLTLHVVVLGGSGYSANSGNRCHYGTIYNSASPGGDGPADNYGMNAVSANSNTPLADAITYAAGYLNPAIANTAIIMLTDGAETCNGDFQGAVAAEVRAGIRMYAIAYQDKSYDLANFANFTSTVSASDTDAIAAALTTAIATTTTTGATCSP